MWRAAHFSGRGSSVRNLLLRLALPPGLILGTLQRFRAEAESLVSMTLEFAGVITMLRVLSEENSDGQQAHLTRRGDVLIEEEEINRLFLRCSFMFTKMSLPSNS